MHYALHHSGFVLNRLDLVSNVIARTSVVASSSHSTASGMLQSATDFGWSHKLLSL
jgi:hypothetical protein